MLKYLSSFATTLLVLCALTVTSLIVRRELFSGSRGENESRVKNWEELLVDGKVLGSQSAKVMIVEFSDYTCRYCVQAQGVLRRLMEKHGERVAVVFRHYPLATESPGYAAALASECAAAQDRFVPYHDALFLHQDSVAFGAWGGLARLAGVSDLDGFQRCVDERQTAGIVEEDIRRGMNIGVSSTPTFIVGGKLVRGLPSFEQMDELVQTALR